MKYGMQPNFIHLNKLIFANYKIIYHINDSYKIKNLSSVHSKHILLFQKFSNKVQQMNLIIVDDIFPILLADVALSSLLNNISSFNDYALIADKKLLLIDTINNKDYFKYKFRM